MSSRGFAFLLALWPFSGVPVRFSVSSNGGRESNECCLLILEGVGLLGQNVNENGLHIGAHFSFCMPPPPKFIEMALPLEVCGLVMF
jgi:hypothetical protein